MPIMRAKMKVTQVRAVEGGEELLMNPVCRPNGYPADGSDEDNTFSKFTPSGELKLYVSNPALFGQFKPGQKFYVDFTEAPE